MGERRDRHAQSSAIITIDDKNPRAEALAFDTETGEITSVGALRTFPACFNSATVKLLGWECGRPRSDPVGGSFGRNPDGTSNGVAYETAGLSGAKWYALMAANGTKRPRTHL